MLILPKEIITVIRPFAQVCSERVWDWGKTLIIGAILAPGKRTVTAVLRVLGLKDERQFQNYHRVLNRAKMRWNVEVTFQEAREHLGLETQRQWSDLAIARTTPALLGLFSLIVLFAHHQAKDQPFPVRTAAWYVKTEPTFSDAIALVRRYLWTNIQFVNSPADTGLVEIPVVVLHSLIDSFCYST